MTEKGSADGDGEGDDATVDGGGALTVMAWLAPPWFDPQPATRAVTAAAHSRKGHAPATVDRGAPVRWVLIMERIFADAPSGARILHPRGK